jgi:threonine synthase
MVTLATAHPVKFRDIVEQATGQRPALPSRIGNLFEREERYDVLPGDYESVSQFILNNARNGRK